MESKNSDSSSAANSEEYEIISSKKSDDLEPKMEGDETALKETISECLNDGIYQTAYNVFITIIYIREYWAWNNPSWVTKELILLAQQNTLG